MRRLKWVGGWIGLGLLLAVSVPMLPVRASTPIQLIPSVPQALNAMPQPVPQAYIKASNTRPEAMAEFGAALATDGDTLVVGAPKECSGSAGINGDQTDCSMPGAGAVYVFVRTNGAWSQQAYLKASNPDSFDRFGTSVAINGDTLAVGAIFESSNATGVDGDQHNNSLNLSGAVYIFTRTNGVWSQQAYLKASNADMDDFFGTSVALAGDTLAVGALGEDSAATGIGGNQTDNSAENAGAVYIFGRSDGVWSQYAYVKASDARSSAAFGTSVALSVDTLVVGAPWQESAYVFGYTGGVWSEQTRLMVPYAEDGDFFGFSVALLEDTVVVGAPEQDSGIGGVNGDEGDASAAASGAAYVFTRDNGDWNRQAYLKAFKPDRLDMFGYSVAVSNTMVLIGAPNESSGSGGVNGNPFDNSIMGSGAAYVFTRNDGTWSQHSYLKASNPNLYESFGMDVTLAGETRVISAPHEDSNAVGINGDQFDSSAPSAGAVYTFGPRTVEWTHLLFQPSIFAAEQ